MSATINAAALVASLAVGKRASARLLLERLLIWSERHAALLSFDSEERDQERVRFNTADGHAFWLACGTTDGDAKVELLTRTTSDLPATVHQHLNRLLSPLLSHQPKPGQVLQIPMSTVRSSTDVSDLVTAMDFALGATTALATGM